METLFRYDSGMRPHPASADAAPLTPNQRSTLGRFATAFLYLEEVMFQRLGIQGIADVPSGSGRLPTLILARSIILMIVANLSTVFAFYLAGPSFVEPVTRQFSIGLISIFTLLLLLALGAIVMKRPELARNVALAAATTIISSVILLTGGMGKSVALPVILTIPCFYYCLVSVRSGIVASIAVPFFIIALEMACHMSGIKIPDMTSYSNPAFNSIMVAAAIYIMVTLCLGGLVRTNEYLYQQLHVEHKKLAHLASIDPLTGIANRRVFDLELDALLALSTAGGRKVGLILLDLNGFKPINDHYGHPVGDEVLKLVADRLVKATAQPHLIARLGGDEFGAIVSNAVSVEQLQGLVRTLQQAVEAPMKIAGIALNVGIAAGFSMSPEDGMAAGPLVRAADAALYHNKRGTLLQGPWISDQVSTVPERRAGTGR